MSMVLAGLNLPSHWSAQSYMLAKSYFKDSVTGSVLSNSVKMGALTANNKKMVHGQSPGIS